MKRLLIRTQSAGVWAGEATDEAAESLRAGAEATVLTNARRIYRWAGAFTLSELATLGTRRPGECQFPPPVPEVWLTSGVIEALPISRAAWASIYGVPNHDTGN